MGTLRHSMGRMKNLRTLGPRSIEVPPLTEAPLRKPAPVVDRPEPSGQKLSKNELFKVKNRCEFLEQEIQRVESLIESTASQLSDPQLVKDFAQCKELSNRHEDLSTQLRQLYLEWEGSLKQLDG